MNPVELDLLPLLCIVVGLVCVVGVLCFTFGWERQHEAVTARLSALEVWRAQATDLLRSVEAASGVTPMHRTPSRPSRHVSVLNPGERCLCRACSRPPPLPDRPSPETWRSRAVTTCAPEYHAPRDVWDD